VKNINHDDGEVVYGVDVDDGDVDDVDDVDDDEYMGLINNYSYVHHYASPSSSSLSISSSS